eukprot:8093273-Pyramimonas_sp.AAC.1
MGSSGEGETSEGARRTDGGNGNYWEREGTGVDGGNDEPRESDGGDTEIERERERARESEREKRSESERERERGSGTAPSPPCVFLASAGTFRCAAASA